MSENALYTQSQARTPRRSASANPVMMATATALNEVDAGVDTLAAVIRVLPQALPA